MIESPRLGPQLLRSRRFPMSFARFRSRFGGSSNDETPATPTFPDRDGVSDGSLHYVVEKAENDTPPTYQEASGAPVETRSPLGYAVGPVTIVFLNLSKMVGTGIYSTRKHSRWPPSPVLFR